MSTDQRIDEIERRLRAWEERTSRELARERKLRREAEQMLRAISIIVNVEPYQGAAP